MSDKNDPFAETPYVPPTDRRPDEDAAVDVPEQPEEPVTESAAEQKPTEEGPAERVYPQETERPEPPAESVESAEAVESAAASAREDAVTAEQPAAPGQSADPVPATPAASASDSEPTEQFTHRYPEQGPAYTAGAATHTQQLPPFAQQDSAQQDNATHAPAEPRKKKRGGKLLAAGAAVLVLGAGAGFAGAAGYDAVNDDNGTPVSNSLDSKNTSDRAPSGNIEKVAQSVLPSVVQINVKGSSESGSGTGIIISSDGQILTNNHVVEGAGEGGTITVSFNDGSITRAEILGLDPKTDLAVIKAKNKSGLTPATLGSSSELKVGQEVVAIGSPFGLESTVTSGIISALNRPVSSSDGSGGNKSTVFPAVQTDAAINPGNSGGPLVDLEGRVIGINSAIRTNTTSTGDSGSIGLGFAIPIDLAKNVSKQLVKGEKVQHALIGVTVGTTVDKDGITSTGAEVKDVTKGGAGDKAGIEKGDIITALNGNPVASSDSLVAAIRGYQPGEKVKITYLRDGKKESTEITLGSDGGKTS